MNTLVKPASVFAALGLMGALSTQVVQAQTTSGNPRLNIDIADQARFVEDLETKSQSDWTFGASEQRETLLENAVEFNERDRKTEDIKLINIEEEFEDWDNTGDDEDSAVTVDVYDF